jgi:hypothetical protein
MRFIRYSRRKKKEHARELLRLEKEEQLRLNREMKEHVRQLREDEKAKLRFEKEKQRKLEDEVRQRLREQAEVSVGIQKDENKIEIERKGREKAFQRRKRRRLYRYTVRITLKNFFKSLVSFRPGDISRLILELKAESPRIRKFMVIVVNSTTLFLLSYFALYFIVQAVTIVTAMMFNYPTILYYNKIYFNVGVEDWYHDSVKTIFSSGPLLAFLASLVFIILFSNKKEWTGIFKLFFLWGFLHGISMLFGAMLVGTLFSSGIGHVIEWMYVMDTGKVLYSIISIFMLVVAGFISIKPFLLSGNTYYQYLTRKNRKGFMWAQVIVPFLFGNLILVLLRLPSFMFYETFVTLTIAVSLIPVVSVYPAYRDLFFDEEKRNILIDWKYILMLFAVFVFYRGILNFGINFPA